MSVQITDMPRLTPTPIILFYHFFMVAFYSMFLLVRDGIPPAPGREKRSVGWVQRPGLALYSVKVVSHDHSRMTVWRCLAPSRGS
jgi:hypothetical protein